MITFKFKKNAIFISELFIMKSWNKEVNMKKIM